MNVSTSRSARNVASAALLASVATVCVALFLVPRALRGIFSSEFLPHSFCYRQDAKLIALHAGTDLVIWLSYLAISCTLVYLVWRARREMPFSWMFLAFGTFIVACGFTHLMEVIVLWRPLYWLSGDLKLVTALASLVTAVALPSLVPQVQAMVGAARVSEDRRAQLESANLELQRVSLRTLSVQDDERRRVARDLHDGLGQYMVGIKMSCGRALAGDTAALHDAMELLDKCTKEVRTMSHLLHPPLLEEIGLGAAIPWYVNGFRERSGIALQLNMQQEFTRLPERVEIALFRVLQESLTNIHRHSQSKNAVVEMAITNDEARLTIRDDGKGFTSLGSVPVQEGVGIASMRERVRELGGTFSIKPGLPGTVVEAQVPLHPVPVGHASMVREN